MVEKTDQETAPAGVRCEGRIELRGPNESSCRRPLPSKEPWGDKWAQQPLF